MKGNTLIFKKEPNWLQSTEPNSVTWKEIVWRKYEQLHGVNDLIIPNPLSNLKLCVILLTNPKIMKIWVRNLRKFS